MLLGRWGRGGGGNGGGGGVVDRLQGATPDVTKPETLKAKPREAEFRILLVSFFVRLP